jgi:uncharacterized protein (TIGR03083 family)
VTTILPKQPVLDALAEQFSAFTGLLATLDDADWSRPTPCPGWDVHAQVAHVIGTESMLAGIDAPTLDEPAPDAPHVRNQIGEWNEVWVRALRPLAPAEMRSRLEGLLAERLEALRTMDQEAWDREGFTPAGPDSYGRFMRLRVFDIWLHEQDIRDALGRPGHDDGPAVELAFDELCSALGFVVGKKAAAPAGTTVTFSLTGPVRREVHLAVTDRARPVERLDGPATVTLRMPSGTFARLCGGRVTPAEVADRVEVDGDAELGRRILDQLAFVI